MKQSIGRRLMAGFMTLFLIMAMAGAVGLAAQARGMAEGGQSIASRTTEASQSLQTTSAVAEENLAAATQMHGNAVHITETVVASPHRSAIRAPWPAKCCPKPWAWNSP